MPTKGNSIWTCHSCFFAIHCVQFPNIARRTMVRGINSVSLIPCICFPHLHSCIIVAPRNGHSIHWTSTHLHLQLTNQASFPRDQIPWTHGSVISADFEGRVSFILLRSDSTYQTVFQSVLQLLSDDYHWAWCPIQRPLAKHFSRPMTWICALLCTYKFKLAWAQSIARCEIELSEHIRTGLQTTVTELL
jgi:hypothetical protein